MSKNKKVCLIDESYKTREEGIANNNKKCEDTYINGSKLKNYPDFKDYLINEWVSKPTRDSHYATQGLCHIEDYVLITSYDPTDRSEENYAKKIKTGEEDADLETKHSKLDIVDSLGRRKSLYFDNKAHVGGIAYHEESGKIFVSNEGKVNVYSEDVIASANNESTIKPDSKYSFSIKDTVGQASYLTINDNNLFVGKFLEEENAKLAKYKLDENGSIIGEPKIYTVPFKKVQGMAVYEKDGKEYYIFSSSHGRTNDSNLIISTLENGEFKKIDNVKLPSMVEQISVTKDGKLGIVFESDSEYYKGATKEIGNVCYMDIEAKINDLEKAKEVADKIVSSLDVVKEKFDDLFCYNSNKEEDNFRNIFAAAESVGEKVVDVTNNIKENENDIEFC